MHTGHRNHDPVKPGLGIETRTNIYKKIIEEHIQGFGGGSMRKIICLPDTLLPKQLANDTKYFSIYSNPKRKGVGFFGLSVRR